MRITTNYDDMYIDDSLAAKGNDLGIPMTIPIDDKTRHGNCNAFTAVLSSIEQEHAIYQGECNNRHFYNMKYVRKETPKEHEIKLNTADEADTEETFVATDLQEL